MATNVKKDRRKSGVKFVKAAKTPTPLAERHELREMVQKPFGLRDGGKQVPRSEKQLKKARETRGLAA